LYAVRSACLGVRTAREEIRGDFAPLKELLET